MQPLNILVVGKYPPIQGGESAKTYWLSTGLAKRGHQVHLVTNANEVEQSYRIPLDETAKRALHQPGVTVYSTQAMRNASFIPTTNPYSEKLASLGLEVVERLQGKVDLILGWYLLPYGVAAHTISRFTGIPYAIQHAGSDIKRLLPNTGLSTLLARVVQHADAILSYPSTIPLFKELGCRDVFEHTPAFPEIFCPKGPSVDLYQRYGVRSDPERTVLFLGKIMKPKGLHRVIESFKQVSRDAHLLVVGNGNAKEENVRVVQDNGLSHVSFIDSIPPWEVPDLVRTVKAVIVPEHAFGVPQHKSRLPVESILCGTPALVSQEITPKYGSLERYLTGIDPLDTNGLGQQITAVIEDSALKSSLSKNHESIRSHSGIFSHYIDRMEQMLMHIATRTRK